MALTSAAAVATGARLLSGHRPGTFLPSWPNLPLMRKKRLRQVRALPKEQDMLVPHLSHSQPRFRRRNHAARLIPSASHGCIRLRESDSYLTRGLTPLARRFAILRRRARRRLAASMSRLGMPRARMVVIRKYARSSGFRLSRLPNRSAFDCRGRATMASISDCSNPG